MKNSKLKKSEVTEDSNSKKSQLIEFAVRYSGKAVESNEMNANELATSLLGLSNAIEDANSIINNADLKIFVKVRASFRPGSFIVDIASFITPNTIQAVFNSGNIETIKNATEILGFVSAGVCGVGAVGYKTLIWLHKQTKGKKILTKKSLDGDNCEITVEDRDSPIVVNNITIKLYENKKMQQALENVVLPLDNEDMSEITFLVDGNEQEKISREERSYFQHVDTDSSDEKEGIDHFLVTQCNFEGKRTGWRLSFGESSQPKSKSNDFPVTILDEDFLHKVLRKEIIISNERTTVIEARYRKITHKAERLTVSWEILEVLTIDPLSQTHTKSTHNDKKLNDF